MVRATKHVAVGSVRCAGCAQYGSKRKAFANIQRKRCVALCRKCTAHGRAAIRPALQCAQCTVEMALAIYVPSGCGASPATNAPPAPRLLCVGCAAAENAYASAHSQLLPSMRGPRQLIDACKWINKVPYVPGRCPACHVEAKRALRIV